MALSSLSFALAFALALAIFASARAARDRPPLCMVLECLLNEYDKRGREQRTLSVSLSNCAAPGDQADRQPLHLFLISEGVWPQGCILDCFRDRHRAMCGSNGRLYKSLCAFKRAQCLDSQLKSVPRANCIDSIQTKCQMVRTQALHSISHNGMVGIFVPECSAEGTFLPVQCHSHTGYCWCSTADGTPVGGTSVLHQRPNCTSQVSENYVVPHVKMSHREDDTKLRPTAEYSTSSPAEDITAPPFWVTILLNSDPKGNQQIKRPTNTPRTCYQERAVLLAEAQALQQEEHFVPECSPDGRYRPVQCHIATGYCWCVRVETGRPLSGTSARNHMPDCRAEDTTHGHQERSHSNRPLLGCPGENKEFLQKLVRALQLEAQQAEDMSSSHWMSVPQSVSTPSGPDTFSPAPLHNKTEGALWWFFLRLDTDGNGILSEREVRPFRVYLRRWLNPRRCAKKFVQHCDRDSDRALTRTELFSCLQV